MGQILLPKQYHPDFATPGKKPIGPIEIDRSSKLLGAVGFALVPQHISPNIDRITGEIPTTILPSDVSVVENNILRIVNPTGPAATRASLRYNATYGGEVILVARIRIGANTLGFSRLVDTKQAFNSADGFYLGLKSTEIEIRGSGSAQYRVAHPAGNDWFDLVAFITGTTPEVFVNGVLIGTDGIGQVNSVERKITVGHNTGQTEFGFDGDIEYLYLIHPEGFNGAITTDPYQILKPSIAQIYSFPSVAAPTGFQAAWARGANTIIQGGLR